MGANRVVNQNEYQSITFYSRCDYKNLHFSRFHHIPSKNLFCALLESQQASHWEENDLDRYIN